ncbi:MAG: WD40/YVTN/BNR-like repeat-containing protein [Ignavibacteria bacterium]
MNTTNAGLNWSISTNKDRDAVSLTFINENTGWLGGRNVVYKTTNGGNNWSTQTIPDMWGYPDDIYFLNSQTGYALTDEVIFKTTNGGTNWNYSLYNGYRQFNSFDFYGSSYGWVCCDSGKFY